MVAPQLPAPPPPDDALVDALAAVRGRAQMTRRRVERAPHLSRAHIAADLAWIEAQTDRLATLLLVGKDTGTSARRRRAGRRGLRG